MAAVFELAQTDAVSWLRSLPAASVDLLITDPAYESLEKHRAVGTTTRLKHSKASSNDWFSIFPNARFPEFFAEVYRALKKNAHFYLFCDPETMFVAKPIAEASGFKFWKPLIWDKKRIGMGYHYRARYECILFFEKGKRRLANLGVPDIIEAPRVHNGYPTEKPVEVAEVLVAQSSLPGELVVDPFMGSGAFGVAAVRNGRSFAGTDISKDACRITKQRLLELSAQPGRLIATDSPESWAPERRVRKITRGEAA
ncbi:MAG: site-specific DNA-methyltransferase [Myxococcales bacterium]|nr:site-specific DNA-methyltransferase [Myxococcales bacterium]